VAAQFDDSRFAVLGCEDLIAFEAPLELVKEAAMFQKPCRGPASHRKL
jgi:hypothetical protein